MVCNKVLIRNRISKCTKSIHTYIQIGGYSHFHQVKKKTKTPPAQKAQKTHKPHKKANQKKQKLTANKN